MNPNTPVQKVAHISSAKRKRLNESGMRTVNDLWIQMEKLGGPEQLNIWLLGVFGLHKKIDDLTVSSLVEAVMKFSKKKKKSFTKSSTKSSKKKP